MNGQVKLRSKAFVEVESFLSKVESSTEVANSPVGVLLRFIKWIIIIVERCCREYTSLDADEAEDFKFYSNELLYDDNEKH